MQVIKDILLSERDGKDKSKDNSYISYKKRSEHKHGYKIIYKEI